MKTKNTKKLPWGRPSKFSEEMVQRVYDFINECLEIGRPPFIERYCYMVGINVDTAVEWQKTYPSFSVAIKNLKETQRLMLQEGIYENSKQHGAGGIFLLKNNHNFKDKVETDITSGGKPIPILGGLSIVQTNDSNNKDQ